ncbi:BatD family protein [Kangiella japonica]
MNRILSSLLILLSLLVFSGPAFAKITLTLDRSEIRAHETFFLRVQVEDPATLNAGINLDFLPDDIQVRTRQEFNNSIIINGQYRSQMGWDFELLAENAGTFTIPALNIGAERSKPFTIRILPEESGFDNPDSAKIKLRANLSDEEVYVQQQLIFTVRIYRSVVTRNQNITPIRVTNALVEQLGDNKTFNFIKNDKSFRVIEQRYAIFPQQSGEMVIEPITYSATILDDNNNSSPWKRSQLKPISLSTQKYTVKVKAKPEGAAEPWLPASGLELKAEWQPNNQTFTVGEPAQLDFIIKGSGLLKTQLPTVTFPEQDGITIYRDTPQYHQRFNRFGVNSYHLEKVVVIPSKAGEISLPEIKIPWWNVESDQQEFATLEAKTIQVARSQKQVTQNTQQAVVPESQETAMEQTTNPNDSADSQAMETTQDNDYWKYASFVLAFVWIATLLLWFFKRNRNLVASDDTSQNTHSRTMDDTPSQLKNIIKSAAANNAKATEKRLNNWLNSQSDVSQVTNIVQLEKFCRQTGQDPLANELQDLQQALYAADYQKPWSGQDLVRLLPSLQLDKNIDNSQGLPGLYESRD